MLARALARRPRIVFLDEATSALDNPTQEQIRQCLERLNATRSVIAHRLSTIRHADRIYVLVEGRVVDEGTYDELVRRQGIFAELVERQLG
jgi:ABC-type multidrug transport system fused ATPase/permease subunit